MSSPELKYITEVLGVRSFVQPEGQAVAATPLHIEGDLSAPLLFCTPQYLSSDSQSLLVKMIKAMKVSSYALACGVNESNQKNVLEHFRGDVIVSFGAKLQTPSQKMIETYSLEQLSQSDPELQKRKKETWGHLKQAMELVGVVH